MARVICKLFNASNMINGVSFVKHKLGMISEEIEQDVADEFLKIEGYVDHALVKAEHLGDSAKNVENEIEQSLGIAQSGSSDTPAIDAAADSIKAAAETPPPTPTPVPVSTTEQQDSGAGSDNGAEGSGDGAQEGQPDAGGDAPNGIDTGASGDAPAPSPAPASDSAPADTSAPTPEKPKAKASTKAAAK